MRRFLTVAAVAAAAAVLLAGLLLGDIGVVWQKAALICLECIGIG